MTYDLILETGDELTAAQLKIEVLTLAAVKSNIILEALEVDLNSIACLSSSVIYSNDPYVLLSQLIDLLLNILISYSIDSFLYLYTLIVLNFYLGLGSAGSLQLNTVLLTDLLDLNSGLSNQFKTGSIDSTVYLLSIQEIDSILIEYVLAVLLLDQLTGSLTLTETGQSDILSSLHVSLLESLLEVLCGDLDLQLISICANVIGCF